MEPNGVQGSQPQGNQAPAQNSGQPQQGQTQTQAQSQQPPAPSTPQFNILPVNPQTGRVDQPAAPAPQPQQTQADQFNAFRQQVAQNLGYQLSDIPADPVGLSQVVAGGLAAMQRLKALEQSQSQPKPPAQPEQANPLQPKAMAPGWDRMVQKNAQGVYEPLHPNFASVAADANYNEGVFAQRNLALNQGQMLPEQQATVKEMVQQQLAAEREALKANMFMEANESKLYAFNPDGSRQMQMNPQNPGEMIPVPSELGMEMRQAAQEILDSGAKYGSQHELAKYALKVAEGRLKLKQSQASQNGNGVGNGPPSQAQPQYNGLADLLANHKNTGNTNGSNINTLPQARPMDARGDYRSALANAPENLNGVDYLNLIFR